MMKSSRTIFLLITVFSTVWGFAQTLPATARLVADNGGMKFYINTIKAATEDDPADICSVWSQNTQTGEVKRLFNTNPHTTFMLNGSFCQNVSRNDVAAADNIRPFDDDHIIVEGCPDARNVWTYIIDLRSNKTILLSSNSGSVGVVWEDEPYVITTSYGYYLEGGRFSIVEAFDVNGNQKGSMPLDKK